MSARENHGLYARIGKRLVDLAGSVCLLTVLSPLLLLIVSVTAVVNRGSVFFVQQRPGREGKPFSIVKLKTMRDLHDADGYPLPDEERLTGWGKFVRKFSFDEVFQLINVLRGEMSLIGPRPLLMQYLPLYSDYQRRRQDVLPGVSGLAQVKGRNELSWRRKFRYDVFYVDHLSARFDLMLVWLTIKKILKADGITPPGESVAANTFRGQGG